MVRQRQTTNSSCDLMKCAQTPLQQPLKDQYSTLTETAELTMDSSICTNDKYMFEQTEIDDAN